MTASGHKKLTPMMQQYLEIKADYNDAILFFRLGDFYEMFNEDAITASKILEITLTSRNKGKKDQVPMCGVPFHAAENYIDKLIKSGYKVAICEQVEDVNASKGIVKRDVVRVVTPGTTLNLKDIEQDRNNYLMCLYQNFAQYGIAYVDISTGDFYTTSVSSYHKVIDEVAKIQPSEIVVNETLMDHITLYETLSNRLNIYVNEGKDWYFDRVKGLDTLKRHFKMNHLEGLGLGEDAEATLATGALMSYLYDTQKQELNHINHIGYYATGDYMLLDIATRRNLELIETMRSKERKGSLMWVLDHTKTAMGARTLRRLIEQPLLNVDDIVMRHEAVQCLYDEQLLRAEYREALTPVYDFERLISKLSLGTANARDLLALKQSLAMLPNIERLLENSQGILFGQISDGFDALEDIHVKLERAIVDEPPLTIREGGIIRESYHEEVYKLRQASVEGKTWLANLEAKEREATGIKNLKVKYNKVFGYYIEVTNSYLSLVPEHYQRKQTMSNAERYFTDELKQMEDTILGSKDRLMSLEYELFIELRNELVNDIIRIKATAVQVAMIDAIQSLAEAAFKNNYVKPLMSNQPLIDIKQGRHPVIEKMIEHDLFIHNDTYLDGHEHRFSIITGPNMAGKSTYMRQVALITLMTQVGSFVPAESATIGPVDRIFTRVGASDDLASGQSTFMVEMTEVANILRNATAKSLIILDEIGRGTSTFDGLSIAWAVVEYIANTNHIGAKTLFATHYHELTELEGRIDGVQNYLIDVKEQGDDIIFLRKIVPGGADKSYGIQVARLAGVPKQVINRSLEILDALNDSDINKKDRVKEVSDYSPDISQINLFDMGQSVSVEEQEVLDSLREVDINDMTPLDALNILNQLRKKLS